MKRFSLFSVAVLSVFSLQTHALSCGPEEVIVQIRAKQTNECFSGLKTRITFQNKMTQVCIDPGSTKLKVGMTYNETCVRFLGASLLVRAAYEDLNFNKQNNNSDD